VLEQLSQEETSATCTMLSSQDMSITIDSYSAIII
jgi:hypothetical protein